MVPTGQSTIETDVDVYGKYLVFSVYRSGWDPCVVVSCNGSSLVTRVPWVPCPVPSLREEFSKGDAREPLSYTPLTHPLPRQPKWSRVGTSVVYEKKRGVSPRFSSLSRSRVHSSLFRKTLAETVRDISDPV